MKVWKVGFLILALATVLLTLSIKTSWAAPTQICPDKYLKKGSPALSSASPNAKVVGEISGLKIPCIPYLPKGGKLRFLCFTIPIIYTNNEGSLTLSNPTQMPIELRQARILALSGDPASQEPGGVTGSIPKLLMPGYKQKDENGAEVDPKVALTNAEGQLVQGWVVENQSTVQEGVYPDSGELKIDGAHAPAQTEPYWDVRTEGQETTLQVGEENYQLEGRFGEVAPLYDRYGLLAQAVSFPTDEPLELPDVDCPAATFDPRPIVPVVDWFRKAIWRAKEILKVEVKECDPLDLDCIADAVTPKAFESLGDLSVQSKVSLAGQAWGNMAGSQGAFATLLPPKTVFKTEENEDPSIGFNNIGRKTAFGQFQNAARSVLKIASLGNVGEAVDCLVYGLTAHPANARAQICDEVLVKGSFLGWPTYHGFIFQGPKSPPPPIGTHSKVEAIDIGPGPGVNMGDPVLATHEGVVAAIGSDPAVYGNYIDIRSTDPEFPASTRYAHLSSVDVGPGQGVSPGQVIGAVGRTGMNGKTGIHLHYEFRNSSLLNPPPVNMEYPYIPDDGGGAIRGCIYPNCPDIHW